MASGRIFPVCPIQEAHGYVLFWTFIFFDAVAAFGGNSPYIAFRKLMRCPKQRCVVALTHTGYVQIFARSFTALLWRFVFPCCYYLGVHLAVCVVTTALLWIGWAVRTVMEIIMELLLFVSSLLTREKQTGIERDDQEGKQD